MWKYILYFYTKDNLSECKLVFGMAISIIHGKKLPKMSEKVIISLIKSFHELQLTLFIGRQSIETHRLMIASRSEKLRNNFKV